jgi:hypothetical protein
MKSIKEILEPFILDDKNHLYSHNADYLIKQLEDNQREFGKWLLQKAADNVKLIEKYTKTYNSNFSNESKSLFSVNYTDGDGETYGATEIDIDKESILNTLDDYLLNNKL